MFKIFSKFCLVSICYNRAWPSQKQEISLTLAPFEFTYSTCYRLWKPHQDVCRLNNTLYSIVSRISSNSLICANMLVTKNLDNTINSKRSFVLLAFIQSYSNTFQQKMMRIPISSTNNTCIYNKTIIILFNSSISSKFSSNPDKGVDSLSLLIIRINGLLKFD